MPMLWDHHWVATTTIQFNALSPSLLSHNGCWDWFATKKVSGPPTIQGTFSKEMCNSFDVQHGVDTWNLKKVLITKKIFQCPPYVIYIYIQEKTHTLYFSVKLKVHSLDTRHTCKDWLSSTPLSPKTNPYRVLYIS